MAYSQAIQGHSCMAVGTPKDEDGAWEDDDVADVMDLFL